MKIDRKLILMVLEHAAALSEPYEAADGNGWEFEGMTMPWWTISLRNAAIMDG